MNTLLKAEPFSLSFVTHCMIFLQKLPGVIAFISAKDIPGKNSFLSQKILSQWFVEEIFVEKTIKYYDQAVGLIVAETEKLANRAALLVRIKYKVEKRRPLLTIKDVRENDPSRITLILVLPARDRGTNVQRVIKGGDNIFSQYFFTMETLSTVTRPSEDGIDVIVSTQWPDQVHLAIHEVLNIEQSRWVISFEIITAIIFRKMWLLM